MLNTLVSTETLSKEEWLKYRNQGIGGSDVSVICGINKYKSMFELWVEMILSIMVDTKVVNNLQTYCEK